MSVTGDLQFMQLFAGCTDDINNYEKQTAAEASNKVFISDKYASLAFNAQRTVEGKVANMDTLVAKLVVNCTSPAGGNLTVKVTIDTLLVDVYNKKNETSYHRFASNWIRLNKSTLTIPEGSMESADTLTVALTRPLTGLPVWTDTSCRCVSLRLRAMMHK